MAKGKFVVLGCKEQPNKKDVDKPYYFGKLLDQESAEGAICELFLKRAQYDALLPLRGKIIQAEIFIDGDFVNLGEFKAAA